MFTIREYVEPKSIEEAYEILLKHRMNTVLGGNAFLKMGSKRINKAIDLKNLRLNNIEEKEDGIYIGASVSYGDLERSSVIPNVIKQAVSQIVGSQLQNTVTVGGSVFSRFGFSDFIPVLLAMDAEIILAGMGKIRLEEFLNQKKQRDILTHVILPKQSVVSYRAFRVHAGDFPLVNVAVSKKEEGCRVVVGARPAIAIVATDLAKDVQQAEQAVEAISFGTTYKASKEYRKEVAKVLVKRCMEEVCN